MMLALFDNTTSSDEAMNAILQLGVTMDYSIFLLNSYEIGRAHV